MRVAAKARDVPVDPLERELLIHEPIVALEMILSVDCGLGEESQVAEAVINRDDNHSLS